MCDSVRLLFFFFFFKGPTKRPPSFLILGVGPPSAAV